MQEERSLRDVSYSHVHDDRFELLAHILVSDAFVPSVVGHVAQVRQTRIFNDYLRDDRFRDARPEIAPAEVSPRRELRTRSDHGIPVTTILMGARNAATESG
jgi:hypothetical protein